jgi:tetratricopeptide (TPR) repeat protein
MRRLWRVFAAVSLGTAFTALVSAQAQDGMKRQSPVREVAYTGGAEGPKAVVSIDILRHPLSDKARQMLRKALEKMKAGEHEAAIEKLQETLAKFPDSAAYAHSLLGVEYLKTDQFSAAVSSFDQAAQLLPHDALTHYNFALSLAFAGDYDRGVQEVRRALELDPNNPTMETLFRALIQKKRGGD